MVLAWTHLRKLTLIGALFVLAGCSITQEAGVAEQDLPELPYASELQAALDGVLQPDPGYDQLGISAAVIVPGYKTWSGISGNSQPGVPLTTDMLFDAGSVEKNFQAALALKLAEEGWLSLDDPLSEYLPTYPNVDPRITVRQLLDHTSGIFNVFEHPDFPWVGSGVDYGRRWEMEEVFGAFVLEPYGPPGYAQHYSSTNYLLLTAILEDVGGAPVPDQIEQYFLKPLKLEHTFVSMGEWPPEEYSIAHPWVDLDLDGELDDFYGMPLTWKVTLTHPVLFSTPNDLARWMHALYHDRTALAPASLEQMLTVPETSLRDPDGALYGLGAVDYTDLLGVPVLGHGGSSLGYSAAAMYLPEFGISLAWMINTGESPPEMAGQLMGDTWSALIQALNKHQESIRSTQAQDEP